MDATSGLYTYSMLPTLAVQLGTLLSVAVGFGLGWVWRGQVSS